MKKILFLSLILLTNQAFAQEKEYITKIKNHIFEPFVIEVPANQKFTLNIESLDETLEEFESNDLKKEKLIGAGKTIIMPIQALKPGEYNFFGDFHQKTAHGKIVAK